MISEGRSAPIVLHVLFLCSLHHVYIHNSHHCDAIIFSVSFKPIDVSIISFLFTFLIWYQQLHLNFMARNSHASTNTPQSSTNTNVGGNTSDPTQNPSSPYYVHPNESPSITMVHSPLTGPNYHIWARSMRRAIISENKFGFLAGAISAPGSFHPLYPAWERCNNLIHSWLMHSVSPKIARSVDVDAIGNVADVWRNLRERFSLGDLTRIMELQQELYVSCMP